MRIKREKLKSKLDILYDRYNKKDYVDPDPLLFLYNYPDPLDREIAGFVASSLAYGRVELIMKTVSRVLDAFGPSPYRFMINADQATVAKVFKGFKYRFAKGSHVTALVMGLQDVLYEHGSIAACFAKGAGKKTDIFNGLNSIYQGIGRSGDVGHLLADPMKTSACKRSHLFLRWMIRQDDVDPGGWSNVSPASLIYPIDTHMYKIGKMLGFTKRKSADKICAREITRGFRRINPEDPVKYDFALTRFGIRRQFDVNDLKEFIRSKQLNV
ncbi:MAG: TIGR02757 family protein [Desulfobacterales bacterium]|nr:TIGR02757 family protein [Desulfobacterales bacterium]